MFERLALGLRAAGEEGEAGDVSGEADARGDDDLAHRPASAEPFAGLGRQIAEFHMVSALFVPRLADLIAKLGGAFVILGLDRPVQFLAETGQDPPAV